jgi:glycosyltransferase involved in cell wall biosynthesis
MSVYKKIKIGIVLNSLPAYSETFLNSKIRILTQSGFEVIVFADDNLRIKKSTTDYSSNNHRTFDLLPVILKLPFLLIFNSLRLYKLYVYNKKSGFEFKKNIISIYKSSYIIGFNLDWLYFGYASVAIDRENLASVMKAKMAVSIRGYDLATFPLTRPNCYRLLWKRLDKLHYLSDNLLGLAKDNGYDSNQLNSFKITPAVDISAYKIYRKTKSNITLKGRPIKITTIARLHWIKGLDDILVSLSKIQNIDFHYTIIGDGTDLQRLLFLINDLNLKDRVTLAGKCSHNQTMEILGKSDLYIQYSEHEGFCNSVLEAQCIGLICIVSDGGALKENIIDGKTGFVVQRRNPDALAEKIREVINKDEKELEIISMNAVERIEKEFNLITQKEKFVSFYSGL